MKGLAKKNDVYFFSLSEDPKDRDPGTRRHFEQFCTGFECIAAPSKDITVAMIARLLRSVFSFDPYTIWRHYSPAYLSRMRELVQTEQFDVIHCDILPLAYTLEKKGSIPCTLTDHDVCHVKAYRISTQTRNPFLKAFTWLEARKLKAFETAIFSRVDLGITVSEYDKKLLQEICPTGTFAVIENGVDTTVFAPAAEETEPHTILWIGGFGYSPNREAVRYFLESIYPFKTESYRRSRTRHDQSLRRPRSLGDHSRLCRRSSSVLTAILGFHSSHFERERHATEDPGSSCGGKSRGDDDRRMRRARRSG